MEQNRKVTYMKKKLFLIVSLCMLVFGLTACGSDDQKTTDYNGISYEQLQQASQQLASTLVAMTEEDMGNYISQGADDVTVNLVTKWKELKPQIGEYVDLGEFSVDKSGKTLTTTQILDFEGRDLTLTFVYQYHDMALQDITLDENFSIGEKMQKAALNTLMGLGTVFAILILISLIINCFKVIPYLQKKAEEKKSAGALQQQTPAVSPVIEPEAAVAESQQDDLELVAVIAAAIAAAAEAAGAAGTDGFVVRSIKRR